MFNYFECMDCFTTDLKGNPHYSLNDKELCLDCALDQKLITKQFYVVLAYFSFDITLNERYKLVEKGSTNYISLVSCEDYKYEVVDTKKKYRDDANYKIWRTNVFKRDFYTCQHCSVKGGKINAHHIKPYKNHIELRTVLENGITLCYECHIKEHKRLRGLKHGKKKNDKFTNNR